MGISHSITVKKRIKNAHSQRQKNGVKRLSSKLFVWKGFIIEGNAEGACGGGEGPLFHIFSTFPMVAYLSFYADLNPHGTKRGEKKLLE